MRISLEYSDECRGCSCVVTAVVIVFCLSVFSRLVTGAFVVVVRLTKGALSVTLLSCLVSHCMQTYGLSYMNIAMCACAFFAPCIVFCVCTWTPRHI